MGAKKTLLLDFDHHGPDGVREIQKKIGLSELQIYSFGEQSIQSIAEAERWLQGLRPILLEKCDGPDLVIFNAGVDSFEKDPLGGVMTVEQMDRRDRSVFETAKMFQVPVVTSLAGGYTRDAEGSIHPALDLHTQTLCEYFGVHAEKYLNFTRSNCAKR